MSRPRVRAVQALALALAAALAAAPALADTTRDNVPQIFTMSPTGVNLQTGVFVHSETDFTIGSLAFVRSWRAVPSFMPNGGLSSMDHHAFAAWNHNYGFGVSRHQTASDGVNVHADGKVYQFRRSGDGPWVPWNLDQHNNNGFGASLTGAIDSNLVFRNQAGDLFTMNSNNQAVRVERADGTRLELGYDGTRRLRTVLSNRGDAIVLDYGANGRLAAACGYDRAQTFVGPATTCAGAPIRVAYSYSATSAAQGWNLTQVTGPDGVPTAMTYDSYFKPNLVCIKVPSSAPCRITNAYGPQPGDLEPALTRPDQVRVQTTATGEVWTFAYINASIYADWPPLQSGELRETESYMTDPAGRTTLAQYENGFLKRLHAPEGLTQYDWAMLNPTVFTLPGGNQDRLQYDLRNNVVSRRKVAAPGSGLADIVATAAYPASVPWIFPTGCDAASQKLCDKPTSTTDERGFTTDYVYDPAHGGLLSETLPAPADGAARPQTRYSYAQLTAGVRNAAGGIVNAEAPVWMLVQESRCRTGSSCAGTAEEIRTLYEYGPSGSANALRLRGKVVTGDGVTARTCFGYDPLGNRIAETGPGGAPAACPASAGTPATAFTGWSRYDAERRLTGTISPDPDGAGPLKHRAVRNTYDAAGRLTKVERGTLEAWQAETVAPALWAEFTVLETLDTLYDAMDRKLRETASARDQATGLMVTESLTQYSYDPLGRLECTAVRMNPATFGALPASACAAAAAGSQGPDRITRNRYDVAGRLARVETGVGTSERRDLALYTYTVNGLRASLTEGTGSRAELRYDGLDRLVRWVMPSDTIPGKVNETNYEEYGWDAAGNRTMLRRRDRGIAAEVRIISYSYDRLNRMVTKNLPGSEPDVSYTYDNLGRQLGSSQPGHALTFSYDALNRKKTETGPLGTVASTYDVQGRRTQLVYPGTGLTLNFDHLDTGEVTRVRENGATSGVGVLATYAYDNLGRRTALTRGNGTTASYGYTGSRLAQLGENPTGATHDLTLTFGHNKAGQIVTLTRSNDLFVYAPVAGTLATPADRLNQLASIGGALATHDPRGNMTGDGTRTFAYDSENRLTTSSGGNTLSYDPLGRLHQHAVTAGATRRFLYDGDAMIGEYDGSNVLQRRFVHGPGVDEPLVWYEGSGTITRKWLHADERGSVIALSDGTGAVVNVNRYDEYGVPQGAVAGRFGYTGQAWLPELGLSYYKARMYHPALGRFMQVDPMGYDDQVHLYAYVGNDPLNRTDPDGKKIVIRGDEAYREATKAAIRRLAAGPGGRALVLALIHHKRTVFIQARPEGSPRNETMALNRLAATNGQGSDVQIHFDPNDMIGGTNDEGSNRRPPFVGLGHEFGHAELYIRGAGITPNVNDPKLREPGYTPLSEQNSLLRENMIRREHGLTPRSAFTGPKNPDPTCVKNPELAACQRAD